MKTRKGWNKSNLDLKDYLPEPCRIDEELHNYLGEIVAPKYCGQGLIQYSVVFGFSLLGVG